jgi:diaminohydroxyphosphoribosylaminopyrimidine deaminase/5-amino-6-(5-phosphoribosylamino)uracil reductase
LSESLSDQEQTDLHFMKVALTLAQRGEYTARPNPMVGCVIVKDNQILFTGTHWQAGKPHAEREALKGRVARGATAYVTLEPCNHQGRTAPCVPALIEAGIFRVVIGTIDPNPLVAGKGIAALQAAGIEVVPNVLATDARALNQGFFSRMLRKKPFVRAKMGMSIDGKIAMHNGESQWITSVESRADVQKLRAKNGAILTSWQTVNSDDCRLTPRISLLQLPDEVNLVPPLRVVLDSQLRVNPKAQIFSQPGKTLLVISENISEQKQHEWLANSGENQVEWVTLPEKDGHIDFEGLLVHLSRLEINDLLVEAGPHLVGALLKNHYIDELIVYMAPVFLGHEAKSLMELPDMNHLSDKVEGVFGALKAIGPDFRFSVLLSEFAKNDPSH